LVSFWEILFHPWNETSLSCTRFPTFYFTWPLPNLCKACFLFLCMACLLPQEKTMHERSVL
jgi:hypothetical protein